MEEYFFKRYGKYSVVLYFYGQEHLVDVEDLYQDFKKRLMQELKVQKKESQND